MAALLATGPVSLRAKWISRVDGAPLAFCTMNAGLGLQPWRDIDPLLWVTCRGPVSPHHFHGNQSASTWKEEQLERQTDKTTEGAPVGIPAWPPRGPSPGKLPRPLREATPEPTLRLSGASEGPREQH